MVRSLLLTYETVFCKSNYNYAVFSAFTSMTVSIKLFFIA